MLTRCFSASLVLVVHLAALPLALGGQQVEPAKPVAAPEAKRTWFPDDPAGLITAGAFFSEHLTGVYLDSITGLWASPQRDSFFFLNTRTHWEDNSQLISSYGLGFRQQLPGQDVILGFNAYYDHITSVHDAEFHQAGLGAEILTRWVDARFNYYLPDGKEYAYQSTRGGAFEWREATLEGFNAEIGFLTPGLDRWLELRFFAGYHHYHNPFGGDFSGLQARAEARLLPGVILDLEYWDEAALMGGHWTAGIRVSVPFSLYNLATGRNPFAGAGEYFRPRTRDFKERLSEMVIRSHRQQAVSSGPIQVAPLAERAEAGERRAEQRQAARAGDTPAGLVPGI